MQNNDSKSTSDTLMSNMSDCQNIVWLDKHMATYHHW